MIYFQFYITKIFHTTTRVTSTTSISSSSDFLPQDGLIENFLIFKILQVKHDKFQDIILNSTSRICFVTRCRPIEILPLSHRVLVVVSNKPLHLRPRWMSMFLKVYNECSISIQNRFPRSIYRSGPHPREHPYLV